jgi:hypothetical protein
LQVVFEDRLVQKREEAAQRNAEKKRPSNLAADEIAKQFQREAQARELK